MNMPAHRFLLLAREDDPPTQYLRHLHNPEAIQLPDFLFGYIQDSSAWISTKNPGRFKCTQSLGLNRFGPTLIDADGSVALRTIMQAWADLFACAPESFVLTGDFEPDIQQYKPLHCERDTVVNTLRAISLLASRVDASHYVLHLGI